MGDLDAERLALAEHFSGRRVAILEAWSHSVKRDPAVSAATALPRAQMVDHIPEILTTFERELVKVPADGAPPARNAAQASAAAHGLQRWQQGYDLRQVTRELGKLNECVVAELDDYAARTSTVSPSVITAARRVWATLCTTGIEASVGQYFQLQQQDAAGQVEDLESALRAIRELERQRADLWQQAAHDLRGNLGVVANATVGLAHGGMRESTHDDFVRILMRNVTTLHHLLDDVTSLARLQAGREHRQIEPLDLSPIFQQLCEGVQPLALQRRLFLRCDGPAGFAADGDAVKIRRIAQNLVLNAVKYTRAGGVTVSWGDGDARDAGRWELRIVDTGPGFHTNSGKPLADALGKDSQSAAPTVAQPESFAGGIAGAGEGIGLSIVKRLCELLDATIETESVPNVGTTFRILFPRQYAE